MQYDESHLKRKSVAKLHRTDNRIYCIWVIALIYKFGQFFFSIFLKHQSTPDPSECLQRRLHLFEKFGARQYVPIYESDLKTWLKKLVKYMYKLFTDRYFGWLNINNYHFLDIYCLQINNKAYICLWFEKRKKKHV